MNKHDGDLGGLTILINIFDNISTLLLTYTAIGSLFFRGTGGGIFSFKTGIPGGL